ncbi:MAG TPA: CHASE4 domain-containing protein [Patescibacteria group bacterium]|nr:CHASE4 domain-containing protein [Patescibacteria group bacterium]
MLLFIAILFVTSRLFLLESFSEIENQKMVTNVGRAESSFDERVNDIEVAISDWSMWDDTYQFVDDANVDYIESNISTNSLTNLNINFMVFANIDGEIVFHETADIDTEKYPDLTDELISYIRSTDLLLNHQNTDDSIAGLVILPGGTPLLIASQPIVKSDGSGPINGTLIFAKQMDEEVVKKIQDRVRLSINYYDVNKLDDEDLQNAFNNLKNSEIFTEPHEEHIRGYKIIKDLNGNPALLMRVEIARDIYRQGLTTINYFLFFVIAIGVAVTVISVLFLTVTIIKPIRTLISATNRISEGNFDQRIETKSKDEIGKLATTFNSMTEKLQKTFKELEETKESEIGKAKELVKLKDEFVFIAAHEIRSPVVAITGFTDMIADSLKNMPKDVLESFGLLKKATERLGQLVNDLLQTARSESGTIKIQDKDVNFSEFLTGLVKNYNGRIKESHLKITLKIDPQIKIIKTDETKLSEIIGNLLTNAIKYNKKRGSINITAETTGKFLKIRVKDTGVGINPDLHKMVFGKFFRAHQEGTEEVEGTGLGLFVTKMLVEKMGGEIGFTSEERVGSEFWFTIPI